MDKKKEKEFKRLKEQGEAQIKENDFKGVAETISSMLKILEESNNGKNGNMRR
jgi:hypothetical protein